MKLRIFHIQRGVMRIKTKTDPQQGDCKQDSLIQTFLSTWISQVDFSWELRSYAVLANCVPWPCQEERRERYATARTKTRKSGRMSGSVANSHVFLRPSLTSLFICAPNITFSKCHISPSSWLLALLYSKNVHRRCSPQYVHAHKHICIYIYM